MIATLGRAGREIALVLLHLVAAAMLAIAAGVAVYLIVLLILAIAV